MKGRRNCGLGFAMVLYALARRFKHRFSSSFILHPSSFDSSFCLHPSAFRTSFFRLPSFFILSILLPGCAAVPGKGDPRDPLESYNRAIYKFNDNLDRAVLKPVAKGYDFVVPDPVKTGIRNFFGNLGEVVVIVNDVLQGKGEQALSDTGRFIFNSTFGMVGLIDIATPLGLPKHNEDFGQSLGKWGVGSGPYFVLPFYGPSTIRDALAKPVDFQLQYPTHVEHVPTRNSMYALEVIDTRASLLGASNVLGEAALDPYVFVRDAYLQRRQRLVYDGNPPKTEDDFDDSEDPGEEAPKESKDKAKSSSAPQEPSAKPAL